MNLRYTLSTLLTPRQVTIELTTPQKTQRSSQLEPTKVEKSKKASTSMKRSDQIHEDGNDLKVCSTNCLGFDVSSTSEWVQNSCHVLDFNLDL